MGHAGTLLQCALQLCSSSCSAVRTCAPAARPARTGEPAAGPTSWPGPLEEARNWSASAVTTCGMPAGFFRSSSVSLGRLPPALRFTPDLPASSPAPPSLPPRTCTPQIASVLSITCSC